jgi:hypothetical protein
MDGLGLASLTKYVKVSSSDALMIEIHVVRRYSSTNPYSWFTDTQMQEALLVAHDMLQEYSDKDTLNKSYKFQRSGDTRILSIIECKDKSTSQHLLVSSQMADNVPVHGSLPNFGLVNINGKNVFPCLKEHLTGGDRYISLKILPLIVSVYMDSFELCIYDGIIKVYNSLLGQFQPIDDVVSLFTAATAAPNSTDVPFSSINISKLKKTKRGASKDIKQKHPTTSVKSKRQKRDPISSKQATLTNSFSKKVNNIDIAPDPLCSEVPIHSSSSSVHSNSCSSVNSHRLVSKCPLIIPSSPELFDDHSPASACHDDIISSQDGIHSSGTNDGTKGSVNNWITSRVSVKLSKVNKPKKKNNSKKIEESSSSQLSSDGLQHKDGSVILLDDNSDDVIIDNNHLLELMKDMSQRLNDIQESKAEYDKFQDKIKEMKSRHKNVESTVISMLSDEDDDDCDVCVSEEAWRMDYRCSPMKREKFVDLFNGFNQISDLTGSVLIKWIKLRKGTLIQIFTGELPSERNDLFYKSKKDRAGLQYRVNTCMLTTEQMQFLIKKIHYIFGNNLDTTYYNYLWLVLFPEALIHLLMDFYNLTYDDAENKMYQYHSNKEVIL